LLYFFTRQNITLAQINNLPELIAIYYPVSFFIIILVLILIYFTFKFSRKISFIIQKKKVRFFQISISFLFLFLIAFGTTIYFPKISKHNTESFNKFSTWKHGGQLYSIIYHYADRRNMIIKLN
jgi:membrane protease YdiL (CAAX protease family)